MANVICVNCMKGILDANGVCTSCKKTDADLEISRRHLSPRTILKGKYLVGKVIGEGGFGITYIGYDLDLEIRVAIKEFCPRDFAARDVTDGLTILPFDRESAEFFEAEKEKFINEAKRLGKFRGEAGIVAVQDYFQENGTAYIVMEYIDGITLKSFQSMVGTAMEIDKALNLMKPVMEGLSKLHENGVIHRDISPDNIMIDTAKQKIYLIDFGTAREVRFQEERSLSVYKKGGYTPIEQQTSHGKQGPWTDVYALCATIYRCITGKSIPEVNNRLVGDELIKPSAMGIAINAKTEAALLHGLAIKPEERIQNMQQLMKELYEVDPKPQMGGNEYTKMLVTRELNVTEREPEPTVPVSDAYAAKRSFEQKSSTVQKEKNTPNGYGVWLLIIAVVVFICLLPVLMEKMSDPSRINFEVEQENGLTKYVEYQAENDYTVTWKDEYGNVVETRVCKNDSPISGIRYEEDGDTVYYEYYGAQDSYTATWENTLGQIKETIEYQNGQPVSGVVYRNDGNIKYYQYETKSDYTVTLKDGYGKVIETTEYRDGQPVSGVNYAEEGYTKHIEYESKDDFTVTWKDIFGDVEKIKEYRNNKPVSGVFYDEEGVIQYYEYRDEENYTVTWKNASGDVTETREYQNGKPVSGMGYSTDGSYSKIEYESEDDYTLYYYYANHKCYGYRIVRDHESIYEEWY